MPSCRSLPQHKTGPNHLGIWWAGPVSDRLRSIVGGYVAGGSSSPPRGGGGGGQRSLPQGLCCAPNRISSVSQAFLERFSSVSFVSRRPRSAGQPSSPLRGMTSTYRLAEMSVLSDTMSDDARRVRWGLFLRSCDSRC